MFMYIININLYFISALFLVILVLVFYISSKCILFQFITKTTFLISKFLKLNFLSTVLFTLALFQ